MSTLRSIGLRDRADTSALCSESRQTLLPLWVSHFATVRHGWESGILFRVCSPACGGAVRRSRTEGDAENSPSFVDSLLGSPLRPAATAAVHLPQLSLGEDTLRDKVSHKPATEHLWGEYA